MQLIFHYLELSIYGILEDFCSFSSNYGKKGPGKNNILFLIKIILYPNVAKAMKIPYSRHSGL